MTLLAEMHVEFVLDNYGSVRVQIRSKRWAGSRTFTVTPEDYNRITREVTLLQHGNVASLKVDRRVVDKPCDSE